MFKSIYSFNPDPKTTMNPFKKSSSAPAAASGTPTPTNTGGAQARATGNTAQGEAAAAPGRGQADTGNQDGARDGPTPPLEGLKPQLRRKDTKVSLFRIKYVLV